MTCYVHNVPGRIRIKSPVLKGNAVEAERVQALLTIQPGIHSAYANPLTGSVIIGYDEGKTGSSQIMDTLEAAGCYKAAPPVAADQYGMGEYAGKVGKVVGKALIGIVVEMAFEGTPFGLLAAII
jgi:hypothetical protein